MGTIFGLGRTFLSLIVSFGLMTAVSVQAQTANVQCPIAMPLHHMHSVLGHGLIMVLQGSDLVMLSAMKSSTGVDELSRNHGYGMVAEGKALIKETLSGSEMKKMHGQGYWSHELMAYTHQLGAEILAVVNDAERIAATATTSCETTDLLTVYIALNHAIGMAAEGANLVILAKMGMAGAIDQQTMSHGRKMIADGRKFWDSIVGGQAIKQLSAVGNTQEGSRLVAQTEKMVKHGERVLSLFEKMPTLPY